MSDQRDSNEAHQLVQRALKDHESALIGYTTGILNGDSERARDVVQDAFLKLWVADHAKVEENVKSWLYTVCRNRALDVLRKEQRLDFGNETALSLVPAQQQEPGHQADIQDLTDRVWELVESLTSNQQEVLKLKFQHDCSYQQIAEITGLSVGNVGFILHTSLKKLRHQLERQLARTTTYPHHS
jgi:RNA polymerase sigma-70 factor (ECF subfamily)